MKDGKLVESGTHHELMQTKSEYFNLYNIQAQAFVEVCDQLHCRHQVYPSARIPLYAESHRIERVIVSSSPKERIRLRCTYLSTYNLTSGRLDTDTSICLF